MTPQIAACLSADIPNLQEKELLSSLNNFKSGSFSSYQQDSNDKKRTKKFRLKRLFVNTIDYLSGKNKINTGALKLRFKLRKNAERKPKIVFFFLMEAFFAQNVVKNMYKNKTTDTCIYF